MVIKLKLKYMKDNHENYITINPHSIQHIEHIKKESNSYIDIYFIAKDDEFTIYENMLEDHLTLDTVFQDIEEALENKNG